MKIGRARPALAQADFWLRHGLASVALTLTLALAGAWPAWAAEPEAQAALSAEGQRLQITDAFIELRTGPGRGYPVFFVAERHQWVAIELRHTDWYKVRAAGGQVGWVQRQQLESTLMAAGGQRSFRDLVIDDVLGRRAELGAGWGRFRAEPMLKLWGSWRFADSLRAEATVAQVQGVFSGTDFWHINLSAEPWSGRRFSPYFAVGVGRFKNIPNSSLVAATLTDARLANAGVGLRWSFGERFVARLDWTLYSAFVADTRTLEYRAVTAGLAFSF